MRIEFTFRETQFSIYQRGLKNLFITILYQKFLECKSYMKYNEMIATIGVRRDLKMRFLHILLFFLKDYFCSPDNVERVQMAGRN